MSEGQATPLDRRTRAVDYAGRYQTLGYVADRVSQAVLACLKDRAAPLVLELGCGTGETSLAVARARPDANVIGLDISAVNIAAAERAKAESGVDKRVSFETADFMRWQGPQVDLIFGESVLHLVEADSSQLAEKLANTLRPGGQLVFTIPRDCFRNDILFLLRRVWSIFPRAPADRMALAVARRVYSDLPDDLLRDRLGYLRLIPERTDGTKFRDLLRRNGLSLVRREIWPVTTLLQASHSFSVWRKE
ncbi:class I SAM-dependent methyltransferase [Bradyrhizobium sp. SZCCHNR1070]|uniref:class I SAM-dependent methyltransferase n=1 Tax=Bradyrhizobium sp. SZCCHNR1070 TaxID=3057361 RepID=UPI0029166716|nr:class I SAM-dependent methyltransferase [Bradyrhizobium sp. SZCCHNR1070]